MPQPRWGKSVGKQRIVAKVDGAARWRVTPTVSLSAAQITGTNLFAAGLR